MGATWVIYLTPFIDFALRFVGAGALLIIAAYLILVLWP